MTIRTIVLALALGVALAASASAAPPPTQTYEVDGLSIYDGALSNACGATVTAEISGTLERRLHLGNGKRAAAREESSFRGRIAWQSEETGKTYASKLDSHTRVD